MTASEAGTDDRGVPSPAARVALGYLVLTAAMAGTWAAFAPRGFYDDFPGGGLHWVASDGPYNEHLVRDVGAFFLALGLLALVGALGRSLTVARVAGATWLVFSVVHISYHLRHLDRFEHPALNVLALSLPIAAAVAAIALPGVAPGGRPPPRGPDPGGPADQSEAAGS